MRRLCSALLLLALLAGLTGPAGPGRAAGENGAAGESGAAGENGVPAKPALLTVVVEHIRSETGRVHVGVWGDAEGFGKDSQRIAGANAPVTGPSQTLVIKGLPPGRYALAAFHDENDNGDFDRTWIGLPSEGLGFSNGAWITIFGAPSFDSAAIELKRPATRAVIALRY